MEFLNMQMRKLVKNGPEGFANPVVKKTSRLLQ